MEDNKIIELYKSGSKDCIEILIEKYDLPLYKFCYHLTNSKFEAEELFQEAWVKCIQNIGSFDTTRSFINWMYAIISNLYKDKYRKHKRWLTKIKEYFTSESKEEELGSIKSSSTLPEEKIMENELKEELKAAVNELEDIFKIPIILFYYKNLSYSDIAEVLNIPEGTVKSRLNLAKKKLKQYMEVDVKDEG